MKSVTLFLSTIALAAAAACGLLYFITGNEKAILTRDLAAAETQLAQSRARINELTAERTDLAGQVTALQATVDELKARNVTLEARNAQLTREMTQVRDQLGSRAAAEQAASRQIAELNRQLLEARAAASATAGAASAETIAAYEMRIADLEAEVAALRRGGDAGAAASSLANVPPDLTGNVIDVGPRGAFVVLDIGTRNGAAPSLEMVLRRGAVIIARVRLTDVKETYSVAHVLPHSGAGNVRPGDTATRS